MISTPFLRMMVQIDTDLSSPAVTNLDLSEVIIMPVTEALLLKVTIFWLRFIANTLIFLSYEPVTICLPSYKSTILVTAASWAWILVSSCHDLVSQRTIDPQPLSLPEARISPD